jgi:hypothetical protein
MIPTALTCRRLAPAAMASVFALALAACEQKPSIELAASRGDAPSSAPAQPVDARQPDQTARSQPPAPSALVAEARIEPEPAAQSSAPAPAAAESKSSVAKSPTAAGKPARTGRPIGDSELAAKVKSAVLAEPLSALLFNVNVSNGVVTLSGTADSTETRDKAGRAASGVEGVKSVNNKIAVISGS